MSVQIEDLELLDAVRDFTLDHPHPEIERFKSSIRRWGETWHGIGDVIFVESNTPHGFRTTDQSLVVYYLWQAGDLRQQSRFG